MRRATFRFRSPLGRGVLALSLAWAASGPIAGATAADLTFVLRIDHGRVPDNMRLIQVKQGDVVKLQWSADQPVIVHLHGYDIERRVEPGAVGEIAFTANATGRFPIHVHTPRERSGSHAHEESPLVYIEVYPR
jgi:hypothetical protein